MGQLPIPICTDMVVHCWRWSNKWVVPHVRKQEALMAWHVAKADQLRRSLPASPSCGLVLIVTERQGPTTRTCWYAWKHRPAMPIHMNTWLGSTMPWDWGKRQKEGQQGALQQTVTHSPSMNPHEAAPPAGPLPALPQIIHGRQSRGRHAPALKQPSPGPSLPPKRSHSPPLYNLNPHLQSTADTPAALLHSQPRPTSGLH